MALSESVLLVFGFIALGLAATLFGVTLGMETLQLIPLVLLQFVLLAGAGFGLAALGGVIPDIAVALPHGLRLLFYLSPSLYGLDLVAARLGKDSMWFEIYQLSPVSILFTSYRSCLWEPEWISPATWAVLLIWSIGFMVLGYLLFRRFDRRLVKSI